MAQKKPQATTTSDNTKTTADVKRLPRKKKKQLGRASKSGKTGG